MNIWGIHCLIFFVTFILSTGVIGDISYGRMRGDWLNEGAAMKPAGEQYQQGAVFQKNGILCTDTLFVLKKIYKRYWGRCLGVPDSAIIRATEGGGSELSSGRAKGPFNIRASGSHNIYYAYPTSYGALTSIIINNLESIAAFTQNTVSVTNASGYTQSYFVYVSNNTCSADVTPITIN